MASTIQNALNRRKTLCGEQKSSLLRPKLQLRKVYTENVETIIAVDCFVNANYAGTRHNLNLGIGSTYFDGRIWT